MSTNARALSGCLLAALSTFAVPRAARAADEPSPDGARDTMLQEEDRIDRLAVDRQASAYLGLRARLLQDAGADDRPMLDRLAAKLALANDRLRTPHPAYDEKLSLCRQIDAIGAMHLARGHTHRAVWWESVCRAIDPASTYADVLRNRIHQWHEDRLSERVAERDWAGARDVLAAWRALVGDERAVAEGLATYATARAAALQSVLAGDGARQALQQLDAEERLHPGLSAWRALRAAACAALQEPFDRAIVEHRAADAAKLLEEMNALGAAFALEGVLAAEGANRARLDELVELLRPEPFDRPFGHLRHPTFRMELGALAARSTFAGHDERIDASANGWSLSITYRQRGVAPGLWHGARLAGSLRSAEDGLSSGSALVASLEYIAGSSGARHAVHAGIGASYAELAFTGLLADDAGSGVVYGSVSAGIEYAPSDSLVVHADLDLASSDALSHLAARAGIRYHTNHSFAIGLAFWADSLDAEDEGAGSSIEVRTSAVGISALVQF